MDNKAKFKKYINYSKRHEIMISYSFGVGDISFKRFFLNFEEWVSNLFPDSKTKLLNHSDIEKTVGVDLNIRFNDKDILISDIINYTNFIEIDLFAPNENNSDRYEILVAIDANIFSDKVNIIENFQKTEEKNFNNKLEFIDPNGFYCDLTGNVEYNRDKINSILDKLISGYSARLESFESEIIANHKLFKNNSFLPQ